MTLSPSSARSAGLAAAVLFTVGLSTTPSAWGEALGQAVTIDDEPSAAGPEAATIDPEADTQRIKTTGPPPEHDELVE